MKRAQLYICLAFVINGIMAIMTGTLLTYFMEEGLSYTQGGFLTSIQSAGNLVMGLCSGLLIHRMGRKKASVLYCLLFAIGFSCVLFGNSVYTLYPLIFISGLGWGLCNNVCHLIAGGKSNQTVLLHTSYAIGAAVAPLLVQLMLQLNFHWRTNAWFIVLPSLLLMLLYLFQNKDELEPETAAANTTAAIGTDTATDAAANITQKKDNRISYAFLKEQRFYICFFLYFCYNGIEAFINSWLITYLSDTGLLPLGTAQSMLSMLWFFIIFCRLFSIILLRLFPRHLLLCLQTALLLICILFLTITHSSIFAVLLVACVGFFMGGVTPVIAINAREFIQGEGIASGILFAGGGLGATLFPAVAGILTDRFQVSAGMYFTAAACLVLVSISLRNAILLRRAEK